MVSQLMQASVMETPYLSLSACPSTRSCRPSLMFDSSITPKIDFSPLDSCSAMSCGVAVLLRFSFSFPLSAFGLGVGVGFGGAASGAPWDTSVCGVVCGVGGKP